MSLLQNSDNASHDKPRPCEIRRTGGNIPRPHAIPCTGANNPRPHVISCTGANKTRHNVIPCRGGIYPALSGAGTPQTHPPTDLHKRLK